MPGAGLARPSDRTLGRLDECCAEFDGGVARFNGVGLRCLVRSGHLRCCREPRNHTLAGQDYQRFDDLLAHDGGVRFPSLGQAQILECAVLSFDEMALDRSQRPILRRQQEAFAQGEGVSRGRGR